MQEENKTKKNASRHVINLTRRENLMSTGVIDVISFDEETIIAETELGMMIIKGINLHVNHLNLEKGELSINGEISSIHYEDTVGYSKGRGGSSLFGKLFK